MNVNRLLRDPADNMARENTKNKAAGRRHEQQNNSIGGKENFHILRVLPNRVLSHKCMNDHPIVTFYVDRIMNENRRMMKKPKAPQKGPSRSDPYEDDDRNNRVSTESPDSYDLSLSMETKILSSGNSSSKDRDKLVPAFRQSYVRHNSNQYQTNEPQMSSGV